MGHISGCLVSSTSVQKLLATSGHIHFLSIQMIFQWICVGESGLPILFLCHLRTAAQIVSMFDQIVEVECGPSIFPEIYISASTLYNLCNSLLCLVISQILKIFPILFSTFVIIFPILYLKYLKVTTYLKGLNGSLMNNLFLNESIILSLFSFSCWVQVLTAHWIAVQKIKRWTVGARNSEFIWKDCTLRIWWTCV